MSAAAQIERTFREEYGRILAALISLFGNFTLAEDALQDALVNALERWEIDGVPRSPGAWLLTVARRRLIDRIHRATAQERTAETIAMGPLATSGETLTRHELCEEAIRLCRVLVDLFPDSAEALGLLALMLWHDSRREARLNPEGELVLLDEQDRARWDRAKSARERQFSMRRLLYARTAQSAPICYVDSIR